MVEWESPVVCVGCSLRASLKCKLVTGDTTVTLPAVQACWGSATGGLGQSLAINRQQSGAWAA